MKAVIIDDEPLARLMVKEYLQYHPRVEVVEECSDGFEGLKAIQQHQPNLVFLDVQMPKINGFEMLELVEAPPAVIFTTAFDAYAMKAFDTHAVDYLLKPFSRERFDKAMEKFMQQAVAQPALAPELLLQDISPRGMERIVVKTGSKIRIIPVHEVLYLEAADDYVKIHTNSAVFLKNRTMAYFEKALPPTQFVRTHRSFIINIGEISRIDHHDKDNHVAVLRNGAVIPVSKSGYQNLRLVLGL